MSLEKIPNFLADFFDPEMNGGERRIYRFDPFLLNVAERQFFESGRPVPLTPKAFDALVYLVERGGHLVEKEELLNSVWPDSFVDEVNIARTIFTLRKALGQHANGSKFIETVPTKGYRFVAEVYRTSDNGEAFGKNGVELVGNAGREFAQSPEVQPDNFNGSVARSSSSHRFWGVSGTILALALVAAGLWFLGFVRTDERRPADQSGHGAAYQAYQQGRLFVNRKRPGDLEAALLHFEKALELDPNYAAAFAGRADTKIWMFWATRSHDDIIQARSSVNRALQLQPESSYAHAILCRIKATYDWDFDGAEKECIRAIELEPDNHDAHHELAMLYSSLGRESEALAAIDAAIAITPISFYKRSKALIYFYARRFPEAIELLEHVKETDSEYTNAPQWLMTAYEMNGEYDKAFKEYLRLESRKSAAEPVVDLNAVYAHEGWVGILRHMNRTVPGQQRNSASVAARYCQLGDKDAAFQIMEEALNERRVMIVHLARDARFDQCRDDPRFHILLKRIGLK